MLHTLDEGETRDRDQLPVHRGLACRGGGVLGDGDLHRHDEVEVRARPQSLHSEM